MARGNELPIIIKKVKKGQLQAQTERADEAELQRVKKELDQAIATDPKLAGLGKNLRVDRTPEGVRIQIVDQDERSMFPLGRAVLQPYTAALMAKRSSAGPVARCR